MDAQAVNRNYDNLVTHDDGFCKFTSSHKTSVHTVKGIQAAAEKYFLASGKWPTLRTQELAPGYEELVPGMPGENWTAINACGSRV